MYIKLVEVCITEPKTCESWGGEFKLDNPYNHPSRLRYRNFWINENGNLIPVGGETQYTPDKNGDFLDHNGNHAHIVCGIERRRHTEADRFVEIYE